MAIDRKALLTSSMPDLFLKVPLVLLFVLLLTASYGVATPLDETSMESIRQAVVLTGEERQWLAEHSQATVRIGQWPPFMMSGEMPSGIAIDFLKVIAEVHGIRFVFVDERAFSWPETLDSVRDKTGVDLIPAIQPTPERGDIMSFTAPYQVLPWVIVTRNDAPFVSSMEDLSQQTVAVQQRFILQQKLEERYPELNLHIITTPTPTLDSLRSVATGRDGATINALPVVQYFIETYGLSNLKVAAPTSFDDLELSMGVRDDWPELVSIIDKTFAAMSHQQKTAIRNRWLAVRVEYGLDPAKVFRIAAMVGLAILVLATIILSWNRTLKRQVAQRKAEFDAELAERIRAEEALKEREERLSILFALAADCMYVCRLDGSLVQVNEQACRCTGYDRDELERMNIVDVDATVSHQDELKGLNEMLMEGKTISIESFHTRKDGSVFPVEIHLSLMKASGTPYVLGIARDITVRREAERELEMVRQYLRDIIDSMPSVLIGVDAEGKVTQWNHAAQQRNGISPQEALGQPLDRLMPSMELEMDKVLTAIREKTHPQVNRFISHEAISVRYEDVMLYPLTSQDLEGAVIRIDDVTERVRLEELMVQNEKMLSVGGVAAGMAHEINNPLAAIIGNAKNLERRLLRDLAKNKEAAESCDISFASIRQYMELRGIEDMLKGILSSGQRAARIVSNMLSFSRKSEKHFGLHSIASILESTLELAINDYDLKKQYDFRKIEVKKDYAPDLPPVYCEGNEIQQVFFNIIKNGAQAMSEKHYVDESPCITLRVRQEDGHVVAEVEDNGPGMSDETRKRALEPFFTTKKSGTGLGLSVSYFIITDQHQGQMEVHSSPDRGTRFVIKLPIGEETA